MSNKLNTVLLLLSVIFKDIHTVFQLFLTLRKVIIIKRIFAKSNVLPKDNAYKHISKKKGNKKRKEKRKNNRKNIENEFEFRLG